MHIVTHRPGRFIGDIIAEVAIMAFLLLLNQLVDNQTGSELPVSAMSISCFIETG